MRPNSQKGGVIEIHGISIEAMGWSMRGPVSHSNAINHESNLKNNNETICGTVLVRDLPFLTRKLT